MSSKQIAAALDISVRTVETHRKHIVAKSGVCGAELLRLATLAMQAMPAAPRLLPS
jgi:FixJ family two-component response regulator